MPGGGQVGQADGAAVVEPGIAEAGHPGAAHLARGQLGQLVQHLIGRLGRKALAPVMLAADGAVQPLGNGARRVAAF